MHDVLKNMRIDLETRGLSSSTVSTYLRVRQLLALRHGQKRRHRDNFFSRLDIRPAPAPVNASPTPSRACTHDSGSPWVATPSA